MRTVSFSPQSCVIKSLKGSTKLRHLDLVESFYAHPPQLEDVSVDCPATLERLTLIGLAQLKMLSVWCPHQLGYMEKLKRLTVGVLGRDKSPFHIPWAMPPNMETLSVIITERTWKTKEDDSEGLVRFVEEHAKARQMGNLQLLEVLVVGDFVDNTISVDDWCVRGSIYASILETACYEYSIPLNINCINCTFLSCQRSSLSTITDIPIFLSSD